MNDPHRICDKDAACAAICPIRMFGRVCPDVEELAAALNVLYGINPLPRSVREAA